MTDKTSYNESNIECEHPIEDIEIEDWKEFTPKEGRRGLQCLLFCWNCEKKFSLIFERSIKEVIK